MASYTLVFTNHDNGESWSTESTALRTPSEVVKDEIKPERFQLEKNYTVTVTIATVLGNVSSNAVFSKLRAALFLVQRKVIFLSDILTQFSFADLCTLFGRGKLFFFNIYIMSA